MPKVKPVPLATHESSLTTLIASLKALLVDPTSLLYYTERDVKETDVRLFLADCVAFNALVTAAGLKTVA